ncbi:MAG: prolipoprotein diacylglyceryl transferase [Vallitaleaceae bacterium]|nr:prolipoprotein diacylglyceryl transferase [Vallitaleaceae bacterium]
MNGPDIIFPNLGIKLNSVDPIAFSLFGIPVYWYGIIICLGILGGLLIATHFAKKAKQDPEIYSEFLIYCLIGAIVGARLFYVIFAWDEYKDNIWSIFATREGGLAIYGGVIGSILTAMIFTKIKKLDRWYLYDAGAIGLILGQAIGRWGNFMNMEAFGGYTDNPLAMAMKVSKAKYVPESVLDKIVTIGDVAYIQVHPAFLYESLWSLGVLAFLMFYFKHKKFDGELLFIYFIGYGLGRIWIEGLRTDQLLIPSIGLPVSQVLSGILIIMSIIVIVVKRSKIKKGSGEQL